MIISLQNSLTQEDLTQQSYIATGVSAGGTSTPIKNITGFQANYAAQIGQTGEETSEIMIISGVPSGTVLNYGTGAGNPSGTLVYAHAYDTPVYQIHYDQVIFYRSITGSTGAFSPLATVSLQPDQLNTEYNDTTGAATYAYYGQYYNSVNGDTSGSSAIFIPGGPTYYSLQKIRQRVKDKLYSAGYIREDSIFDDWINEWYEIMTNSALKVNQNYMLGTTGISFGTAGYGTVSVIDFKQPVKFEVSYDNGVTYTPSHEVPVQRYSSLDYFNPNAPQHSWIGETIFQVLPASAGGTVLLTYGQRFTPLVNDTDELTQTLKGYTTCCIEYCLSVAYGLDQKDTESQQHFQTFGQMKGDFIAEVTPRDISGPKNIDLVEGISGMQEAMDISGDVVF